jgi:hypothetical protein
MRRVSHVFRRGDVPVATRVSERARRGAEGAILPAWVAAACFGALMAATRIAAITSFAGIGLVTGLAAMFLSRRRDAGRLATHGCALELDDAALTITASERAESVARADIDAGWTDEDGRTVLRLRSGKEIVLSLGADDGRELLKLLGLTAGDRTARIPYASAVSQLAARLRAAFGPRVDIGVVNLSVLIPALLCLIAMGSGAAWWEVQHGQSPPAALVPGALALIVPLLGLFAAARGQRRRWVTVGADGISIRRALRRPRFVAWPLVSGVVRDDTGVRLELKDGTRIELDHAHGGDALYDKIREAMALRASRDGAVELQELDRRGRPVAEWRDELKRIGEQPEGYREGYLDADRLAHSIGDPGRPIDRRVGAALLLGEMGEPERKRVRIAIDSLADDATREALERAAEGEIAEADLERAERRATR